MQTAAMSTADSLVLSCSAAVTHDLLPQRLETSRELKTATAAVTGLALAIALTETESVFQLVILSWSMLAAAFAPLLTLFALGRRISEAGAIAAMVAVTLAWRWLGWQAMVYEGLPGILDGYAVAAAFSSAGSRGLRAAAPPGTVPSNPD